MGNCACCNVGIPLAKRLEWSMSAFVSLTCMGIGIAGLAGGLRLGGPCLSCFYTSLIMLVLGTWVQIPSAVGPAGEASRSKPRLLAMWSMAAVISVAGLMIGIIGLAGGFTVLDNNCFYPGLLTLVIGSWVKVPTPAGGAADTRARRPGAEQGAAGAPASEPSEPSEGDPTTSSEA